eukprot:scaffold11554_cov98-Isochrysis_galbana.AAC.8
MAKPTPPTIAYGTARIQYWPLRPRIRADASAPRRGRDPAGARAGTAVGDWLAAWTGEPAGEARTGTGDAGVRFAGAALAAEAVGAPVAAAMPRPSPGAALTACPPFTFTACRVLTFATCPPFTFTACRAFTFAVGGPPFTFTACRAFTFVVGGPPFTFTVGGPVLAACGWSTPGASPR